MKKLLLVLAIAACGGNAGHKAPMKPMEPAPTECQTVAAHVAEAVMTFKDPPPTDKATVAEVIGSHCEADKWSAEAKKCFGSMTEATAEDCRKTLTADQVEKAYGEMMSKMKQPPAAQSAPGAPATGGGPNKSNDPDEGGE